MNGNLFDFIVVFGILVSFTLAISYVSGYLFTTNLLPVDILPFAHANVITTSSTTGVI